MVDDTANQCKLSPRAMCIFESINSLREKQFNVNSVTPSFGYLKSSQVIFRDLFMLFEILQPSQIDVLSIKLYNIYTQH